MTAMHTANLNTAFEDSRLNAQLTYPNFAHNRLPQLTGESIYERASFSLYDIIDAAKATAKLRMTTALSRGPHIERELASAHSRLAAANTPKNRAAVRALRYEHYKNLTETVGRHETAEAEAAFYSARIADATDMLRHTRTKHIRLALKTDIKHFTYLALVHATRCAA